MSFHCMIYSVPGPLLEELRSDTDQVLPYIYGPENEEIGFTENDFEYTRIPDWCKNWKSPLMCWLEQTQGGLDFIMCGETDADVFPKGFLCNGGERIFYDGDIRCFDSDKVYEIHKFLESLNEETLMDNFNLETIAKQVYPFKRWYEWDADAREEGDFYCGLLDEFVRLKTATKEISDKFQGMIVVIG